MLKQICYEILLFSAGQNKTENIKDSNKTPFLIWSSFNLTGINLRKGAFIPAHFDLALASFMWSDFYVFMFLESKFKIYHPPMSSRVKICGPSLVWMEVSSYEILEWRGE